MGWALKPREISVLKLFWPLGLAAKSPLCGCCDVPVFACPLRCWGSRGSGSCLSSFPAPSRWESPPLTPKSHCISRPVPHERRLAMRSVQGALLPLLCCMCWTFNGLAFRGKKYLDIHNKWQKEGAIWPPGNAPVQPYWPEPCWWLSGP